MLLCQRDSRGQDPSSCSLTGCLMRSDSSGDGILPMIPSGFRVFSPADVVDVSPIESGRSAQPGDKMT